MLDILKIIILSLIQGITEWIPVSSSAHLVIFQNLLNADVSVSFDIALHLGTAFSALIYFRKDVYRILEKFYHAKSETEEYKTALYILLAFLPTVIFALIFENILDYLFTSLILVSLTLITTGSILFLASFFEFKEKVKPFPAFVCGIAQGISIIPGLSRSGLTMSALILSKVKREEAVKFSFILAIPTIFAAALFKLKDIIEIANLNLSYLVFGFILSAVVGYASISFLFKKMLHKRFKYFAYYCWFLGILLLVLI